MLLKDMNITLNDKEKRDLGILGLKEYLTSKGKENVDDLFTEWEEGGIGGGGGTAPQWVTIYTNSAGITNNQQYTLDETVANKFKNAFMLRANNGGSSPYTYFIRASEYYFESMYTQYNYGFPALHFIEMNVTATNKLKITSYTFKPSEGVPEAGITLGTLNMKEIQALTF